jgi:NAD(P)H-nitrite reductase large subunit
MEIKELQKLRHDELMQLHQDKQISTLQFVMANDELSGMFADSCKFYNLEATNEVAEQWLDNHTKTFESNMAGDNEIDINAIE